MMSLGHWTGEMNQLCKVCGEPAAGFHFGAFTCEGCKSFFGRTYNNVSGVSECKNGGRCEINKKNRTACKSCRLRKCLQVGMSKSGSRYGRRSNWFKIHCLLASQGNGGTNGERGEQNNNTKILDKNTSFKNGGEGRRKSYGSLGEKIQSGENRTFYPHRNEGSEENSEEEEEEEDADHGNSPNIFRSHPFTSSEKSLSPLDKGDKKSSSVENGPVCFSSPSPNSALTFDLLTRDILKLGYDPLRLFPHLSPYRFMLPPGGSPNLFTHLPHNMPHNLTSMPSLPQMGNFPQIPTNSPIPTPTEKPQFLKKGPPSFTQLPNLGNLSNLTNLAQLGSLGNLGQLGNLGNLGQLGNLGSLGNLGLSLGSGLGLNSGEQNEPIDLSRKVSDEEDEEEEEDEERDFKIKVEGSSTSEESEEEEEKLRYERRRKRRRSLVESSNILPKKIKIGTGGPLDLTSPAPKIPT